MRSPEQGKTNVLSRLLSYRCIFFQAEDGIRDLIVTGVQTCALPISMNDSTSDGRPSARVLSGSVWFATWSVSLQAIRPNAMTLAARGRNLDIDGSSTKKDIPPAGVLQGRRAGRA